MLLNNIIKFLIKFLNYIVLNIFLKLLYKIIFYNNLIYLVIDKNIFFLNFFSLKFYLS